MCKKPANRPGAFQRADLERLPGCPSAERFAQGKVAVLECGQEIPCNPCEAACPFGAISVGKPITNLPHLVAERCKGCGLCVAACPGLAIFLVDKTYSKKEALVTFPYEYLPRPQVAAQVEAVNRQGEVVCSGRVYKVEQPPQAKGTALVTLAVPQEWADDVRGFAWWKGETDNEE